MLAKRLLLIAAIPALAFAGACLLRPAEVTPGTLARSDRLGCSPYSESSPIPATPVAWSFRLCDDGRDAYRIELGFANRSSRPVRFRYRLWLESPGRCRGRGLAPSATEGVGLPPRTLTTVRGAAIRVPKRTYGERVWLCLSDLEGVGPATRLRYLIPCMDRVLRWRA